MKKKILFLPTYRYLSLPCFNKILEHLDDTYDTFYIDISEYSDWGNTEESHKEKYTECFDFKNNIDFTNISKKDKIFKFISFQNELKERLKEINPDIIITTSDMTRFVKVIDRYSVQPIYIIQPSFFDKDIFKRSFIHDINYILFNKILKLCLFNKQNNWGNELKSSKLFLWGEYFKNLIEDNTSREIHIVGNVNFDSLKTNYDKTKIKDKLFSDRSKKIVLICTDGLKGMFPDADINELYNIYNAIIKERTDLVFVIKPHPRESVEYINNMIDNSLPNVFIMKNTNLYELINICDIQISSFSATSFEAVVMKKPIILLNPNNLFKFNDYFEGKIEKKVSNYKELSFELNELLNEKNLEIFYKNRLIYLSHMVHSLDCNASKRIIDVIKKDLKEIR